MLPSDGTLSEINRGSSQGLRLPASRRVAIGGLISGSRTKSENTLYVIVSSNCGELENPVLEEILLYKVCFESKFSRESEHAKCTKIYH
jgi:hypothetical protein